VIQAIAFYMFAAVVILSAAMTISSRNPVHSVLWLILAFFNAAGLMVIAGAEFIAMLLVIVYVGAVAVLFLFVVMMLDIDFAELRAGFVRYAMFGLALAVVLLAEVIIGVGAWSAGGVDLANRIAPTDAGTALGQVSNIKAMGLLLYSRYLYVFEAAGFVLLVAMIGAIVLTHRQRGGVMKQNVWRQINRRSEDAIRKVNQPVGQGVEL
jgi:NADH-quinone oxidoreductase subunit J